jgi:LytR cell envelope-related transcriptional attenuator
VLPPRTGTVPPVRRIPAGTAAGNPTVSQAGVLGQAPGKPKRNPVYVVLAVMGVLILGAGAAIGVPKLVNGGSNDNSTTAKKSAQKSSKATKTAPLPTPTKDITVAVLNGTTVPGLAAQIGDQIENVGFALGTVSNATEHQRANSVAMYAAGHQRDARAVARRLHIRAVEPVDANSQAIAGDATVVVIVGSDQTR